MVCLHQVSRMTQRVSNGRHRRGTQDLHPDPELQYDYEQLQEDRAAAEHQKPIRTKKKTNKRPLVDPVLTKCDASRTRVLPVPEKGDPLVESINRHLPVPLPRLHFILQMIAPRGSGKTTVLINFLQRFYFQTFDEVYVVSPTMKNDSKWDNVPLNPTRVFLNPADAVTVCRTIEAAPKKHIKLCVFDDCIGKGMKKRDQFFQFLFQHRHWKTSIISCVQSWKMTERMIRDNTTHYVLFPIWNEEEVKDIALELCMDWRRLWAMMPIQRFEFLFFDRQNNAIYKNFEEFLGPIRAPPNELDDEDDDDPDEDEHKHKKQKRSHQ